MNTTRGSGAAPPSFAQYSLPRIGSLCSGYGGLDLGLITALGGGSVAWHVENDKHPSAVLEARFPGVPNYGDITTTDWAQIEPVDWLTAGYPCQPFSHAGKRKGSADERHLWPFVAAAIGALHPRRVLLENVAGHVSLGLDAVLWDLAALGYDATWGVVRAADAGAPHGRARIFIVASDTAASGRGRPQGLERGLGAAERLAAAITNADDRGSRDGRTGPNGWSEPVDCVGTGQPASHSAGDPRRFGNGDGGTPADADLASGEALNGRPRSRDTRRLQSVERGSAGVEWGAYTAAIDGWERITGRRAPRPTEPGRTGERLSPRFVEWLMGLPDGWVADILPRSPALKCLGNGVVPQQAALAVSVLLHNEAVAA